MGPCTSPCRADTITGGDLTGLLAALAGALLAMATVIPFADGGTRLVTGALRLAQPGPARAREVIALVAEGRSNKGTGQRLFIMEGAVQKQVTSIFMKLGLPPSDDDHRRILAVPTYVRS